MGIQNADELTDNDEFLSDEEIQKKVKEVRTKRGKQSKRRGDDAERHFMNEFKKMGHDKCMTSRNGSKAYDAMGIDLINLPINVQVKQGAQKSLSIKNTLKTIKERIDKQGTETDKENPLVLIHRTPINKRRTEFDDIVSMTFADFQKIFKCYKQTDNNQE